MILAVAHGDDESVLFELVQGDRVRLSFLGPHYGRKPIVTLNEAELTQLLLLIDEAAEAHSGWGCSFPISPWVQVSAKRQQTGIRISLRRCNQAQDRVIRVSTPLISLFRDAAEKAAVQAYATNACS